MVDDKVPIGEDINVDEIYEKLRILEAECSQLKRELISLRSEREISKVDLEETSKSPKTTEGLSKKQLSRLSEQLIEDNREMAQRLELANGNIRALRRKHKKLAIAHEEQSDIIDKTREILSSLTDKPESCSFKDVGPTFFPLEKLESNLIIDAETLLKLNAIDSDNIVSTKANRKSKNAQADKLKKTRRSNASNKPSAV